MDENEKNKIVSAYFAAAEAMVALEEGAASSVSCNNIIPFVPADQKELGTNASFYEMADSWDASKHRSDQTKLPTRSSHTVKSTKTGAHALGRTVQSFQPCQPGYLSIGTHGLEHERTSALAYWEDLEKHQWMLDVLAELEVYASANSLAETAEALVAARCEIISLAARSR